MSVTGLFPRAIRARSTKLLVLLAVALLVVWWCIPRPALYVATTFSNAVYDRDGRLLRLNLAGDQRYRLFVPLSDIAPTAVDATLLYEDRYFRQHPGVNVGALTRAAWTTYVRQSRRMGASTITMQLARLRFDLNTRTIGGKLIQIGRALQLERHYTKDQILEAYLNLAPYGGNIEGIGTAALVYFDKPAKQLNLAESLALAVIPQNPARRAPTRSSKLKTLYSARERLFALWHAEHNVSKAQTALLKLPLQVRHPNQLPYRAPHFVRGLLNHEHGEGVAKQLISTISLPIQQAMENRLERYLERRNRDGLNNASAMLIDTRSMEVLTSIGSANFQDVAISGQVDGVKAKRSPGSTLKPFVYGLAIDQGLIHPMSLLSDAPKRFGVYTPENFDRGFMGPVLAKDALIYSRNVPAIALLNRVGQDTFHALLQNADVRQLKSAAHYGLGMVLGGNELTMEELIKLYAMLANGGTWQELVRSYAIPPTLQPRQLMSPEASYLVLEMLRKNPRPDALTLGSMANKAPVAWKTGTSYAYRDAWTVGLIGPYALAVWVGNFDGSANPALVGRQAAAPLFFELVDTLLAHPHVANTRDQLAFANVSIPEPELNVRRVAMCTATGDLPNRYCPDTSEGWFIPGVSPIKVSNVFRPVHIDTRTGRRACNPGGPHVREEVYEFWPSDIETLFRQAGVALRRPPTFSAECTQAQQASLGQPPEITSPAPKLKYLLRPHQSEPDQLALTAITDADVSSLFWFVDDRFIAEVSRNEPLLWTPEAGAYDILVVDDLGRSDARNYHFELAQ